MRKLRPFKLAQMQNKISLKERKHAQSDNNSYLGDGGVLGKLDIAL